MSSRLNILTSTPRKSENTRSFSNHTKFCPKGQTTPRLFHSLSNSGIYVQAKDVAEGLPEENPEGGVKLSLGIV